MTGPLARRVRHLDDDDLMALTIAIDWDVDLETGRLLDNRTGLPLLVDGQPNPAIPDAPDRPGYVRPDYLG